MIDLNTAWFILVAVLIAGYGILDGFDLGVGVLHLFTRSEHERRISMNAIGPVWDGNEVWLLTAGGALFAAFPPVYATVFSGFYLALMLLLAALIFRAVSLEFRGKVESARWKRTWDWAFGLGSVLPAVLFGVAVGNILRGVPINAAGDFAGTFLGLLNPYSLLMGCVTLALFTLHGALYLTLKTEGEHRERMAALIPSLWIAFVALYAAATGVSVVTSTFLFSGMASKPLFWPFVLLLGVALAAVPLAARVGKYHVAFLASSTAIVSMVGLAGVSLFPRLVPSSIDLAYSLTAYNASSTPRTLTAMLVIAVIGMPLVIGYTVFIYRVFRGRVILGEASY